jgi:hypothetical protein
MSIHPSSLNTSHSEHWRVLRHFILGGEEVYLTEIEGDNTSGYRFQYISNTASYLSQYYPTREAAIEGLNIALLRSLVHRSPHSLFVIDGTGVILYQSEKNIGRFGLKQGKETWEIIKTKKTSWVVQEVSFNHLSVYREVDG